MTTVFERKDLKIILVPKDGTTVQITPKDAQFSGLLNTALISDLIVETEVEIPVNCTNKQLIFIAEYLQDLADNKISGIGDIIKIPDAGESLIDILNANAVYDIYIEKRHHTNEDLCGFLAAANYFDIPSLISLLCAYFMMIISTEIDYIDILLDYNRDSSTSLKLLETISARANKKKTRADPVDEDVEGELKIPRGPEGLFNSLFKPKNENDEEDEEDEKEEKNEKKVHNISLRSQYLSSEMKDISYVLFKDGYLVATKYYFNSDKSLYGYAESIKPPVCGLSSFTEESIIREQVSLEKKLHNFICTEVDPNTIVGYDLENEILGRAILRSIFLSPPTGKLMGRMLDDIELIYRYQDSKKIKIPSSLTSKDVNISYRKKRIISKLMECADFPTDLIPFCLKYDVPDIPKYDLNTTHICPGPMGDLGADYENANMIVGKYIIQNGYDVANKYRIIATKITGKNNQIELIPYISEQKIADKSKLHQYHPSSSIIDVNGDIDYSDVTFEIDNRYYILNRRNKNNRRIYVWDMKESSTLSTSTIEDGRCCERSSASDPKIKNSDFDFDIENDDDVLFMNGANGIIISNSSYHGGLLAYTIKGKRIYIPDTHLDELAHVTSKYWLASDTKTNDKYLIDISTIDQGHIHKYKIPYVDYSSYIVKLNETTLQFFALDDSSIPEDEHLLDLFRIEEKTDQKSKEYYLYTFADGKISKKKISFFPGDARIETPSGGSDNNKYKVYLNPGNTGDNCCIFDAKKQTTMMKKLPSDRYNSFYINDELVLFMFDERDVDETIQILNMTNGSIRSISEFNKGVISFAGSLSDGTLFIQSSVEGSYAVYPNGDIIKIGHHSLHYIKEIPNLNRVIALIGSDNFSDKDFTEVWC